ncbi:hypothetical protein ACN26Z_21245 [Verrucosispora sp. WMMD703]|uniref:hypothetical protein n=1 Tax=Verrucosispora sp. WMMD703 TaxID=3403463 RepID=UPI003B94A81B
MAEFYGSDEVRSAIAKLDVTLELLERPETEATMMVAYVGALYAECVSLMRPDPGLPNGGRVDLGESRTEVMLHVLDLFKPPEADDPFKDLPEPGDALKDLPG